MIAKILSAGLLGIDAYLIDVEVDIRNSHLPVWSTVGLPESAVKEGKERVVSAIKNSGYDFLYRKVTINLAPADTKKAGTAFDLPVAIGLMVASGTLNSEMLHDTVFVGELSLTGDLRPVPGILPMAVLAQQEKIKRVIICKKQIHEAVFVSGVDVYGFEKLSEVVEFLSGKIQIFPAKNEPVSQENQAEEFSGDYADIFGQYQAKRVMEISASGGHHVLLSGPPGSGKTMLASRMPSILPMLSFNESLETSKVYSVMGMMRDKYRLITRRPFRDPHHSISNAGLIGGGSFPRPGEVSLAHNGILFLDELTEFKRPILELLRQPLESRRVTISRARQSLTYPAQFILVASCNPCPCGYLGHPKVSCRCTEPQIHNYQAKLSGPLLDRIDLHIEVPPVPYEDLRKNNRQTEASQTIAERVVATREKQRRRFSDGLVQLNAGMTGKMIKKYCVLDDDSESILRAAMEKFHLSARGVDRLLKVSRTIADMEKSENILSPHILEAVQYRCGSGVKDSP